MLGTIGKLCCVVGIASLVGCEPTNQGYMPQQPIDYSHAVHAGAMQIPCQYCHFGAERGRSAGIPSAQICMNCHKQVKKDHPEVMKVAKAIETNTPIQWVRVHSVPDHVYFNHSIHVAKNVSCQTCHGPVESMGRVTQWSDLTMGWCIDCHRNNSEPPVGHPEGAPVRSGPLTDCAVCHH